MKYPLMSTCIAVVMVIFGAASAHAQFEQPAPPEDMPEVTDQELQIFVDASIKAQQIQNEAQIEMVAIVEEEELDVETYNKILQGMQMEQSAEEMEVSESDVEKFESASGKIGEIEMEMEDKLVSAIEEEGLELDRFQEIFMTVQTDPELQQKMQQMLQESQMQQE